MYLDIEGLEDNVKPGINNIRKYLDLSSETLGSISIPSDFSYRNKLNSIPQIIDEIDNRVYSICNWLDNQIYNFKDAEYSNNGLVDNLLGRYSVFSMIGNTYNFGANGDIGLESNAFGADGKNNYANSYFHSSLSERLIDPMNMIRKKDNMVINGPSMDYYNQRDCQDVEGISIKENGCGPTCLAMVFSSPKFGSQHVTPEEVAAKAKSLGVWGTPTDWYNDYGAHWVMFEKVGSEYNVNNVKQINPKSNPDEIYKALENRNPVILSISGVRKTGVHTKFTSSGHYILADGFYEDGRVRILDPNATEEDEDYWANFYIDESIKKIDDETKDGLFTGAKQAWIFYDNQEEE